MIKVITTLDNNFTYSWCSQLWMVIGASSIQVKLLRAPVVENNNLSVQT